MTAQNLSDILIREYRHPEDYSEVYRLWTSVGEGIHVSFSDQMEEIERLIQKSPGLFFVAERKNEIIGTVMGGFDGRRGLIYHLAVLPKYQKRHLGSELLSRVESELLKTGCSKVYLFVVPENIKTAEFYKHNGYEQMNVIPFTKYLK